MTDLECGLEVYGHQKMMVSANCVLNCEDKHCEHCLDEQIYYLSHSSEDHAVAVLERSRSNGLVDRLDDFLSELLAYFR